MKKGINKLLSCLIALTLIFALTPAAVLAAGADVEGNKTASPAELNEKNRTTTAELSLPSAERKNEVDVVFVMDKSTSTQGQDFSGKVRELLEGLTAKNVKVNVGVVKFRGRAQNALGGLIEYTDANKDPINAAINQTPSGSGTNIHGGLVMADSILSGHASVPNVNKYVILLTDGKSYIWNDAVNNPTCFYMQWYKHYKIQDDGKAVLLQAAGQDKGPYKTNVEPGNVFDVGYGGAGDYPALYASNNAELTGTSKFDQYCKYADGQGVPSGAVNPHETNNGAALFADNPYADYQKYYEFIPDAAWKDIKYMEANPYKVIKNEDDTYSFDENNVNPAFYQYHPDGLQKGLYKAGHLWTDMKAKYNCASVIYSTWGGGQGLELAKSFCSWIKTNSHYSADAAQSAQVAAMFGNISTDIIYMVKSGVVTDVIHEDFELVKEDGKSPFKVTLGGAEQAASGEGPWNFGEDTGGVYPYVVSYDEATRTIRWTINVPVENAKPVKLSYALKLKVENATEGEHDTNERAELSYVSSDGTQGKFTFPKPKVNFVPKTISIEGLKTWDDGENQDGKRPASLKVDVKDGDEVKKSITLDGAADAEGEVEAWKYKFEKLRKYKPNEDKTDFELINYTIAESDVAPYTADPISQPTMSESIDEYTVNLKNKYEPETTVVSVSKEWDDDNDCDGLRPEEITVQLYADGAAVSGKTLKLNKDNGWRAEFKDIPVFKAVGQKIKYTVDEAPVPDGYDKTISGNAEEGFIIKNVHKPSKIDINVKKVWKGADDKTNKRPDSVTVKLYADGKDTGEKLEIKKADGWKGSFKKLYEFNGGKKIVYTIKEESVKSYKTKISGDPEKGFTVTNTYKPPVVGIGPKTGDINGVYLWSGILLLAVAAGLGLYLYTRSKKEKESGTKDNTAK